MNSHKNTIVPVQMQNACVQWPLAVMLICSSWVTGCASSAPANTSVGPATPASSPPAPVVTAEPPASPTTPDASSSTPHTNDDWWPNRLDLRVLKAHAPVGDPVDDEFVYAKAFSKLDLAAVKKDLAQLLTTSKDWWPADWGHYGGLMIRLAWHSAGTYRVTDGRGGAASGTIRFAPLNSWPDNANLDKARRLLWPVKKKYGRALSWADLMVLAGNVSLETMGLKTFGFGGGREDVYEPTDIDWGPETKWLADQRFSTDGKQLDKPLGASQMGLIYVNPEGPNGKPDPLAAAQHIRITFARMAMNDEETVALIAGGHTLGKSHGAAKASAHVGREPEATPVQDQGLGWKNTHGSGKGADTITSGIEGAWTYTPIQWSHDYFSNMFEYDWELIKGPGGAYQWTPKGDTSRLVPDAHIPNKGHKPMMLTTDLALKEDPAYRAISERFYRDPEAFKAAFARAWYKLTHRDMGPHARLLGPEVPEPQLWQDPVPALDHPKVGKAGIARLKKQILAAKIPSAQLIKAAWASASTYRDSDMRGGANGARVRLAPQKDWPVNEPAELAKVLSALEDIASKFNARARKAKISMADMVVLAGNTAIEEAAKRGGHTVKVPFEPGRTDATPEMTDVASVDALKPSSDGFRNYVVASDAYSATQALVERADALTLTAAEMTVLVGGLRSLAANHGNSKLGVLTQRPGTLSNDFFVHLLDMGVQWQPSAQDQRVYEGKSRKTGAVEWTASAVDLVFGSNSQLRALAEVYAADDAGQRFVDDFVAAWTKVMNLDRF